MKVVARNRKAYHDYFIEEKYEAGIVLQGTEVKAVREGRVNLKDSYAEVKGGEVWLKGVHISVYDPASYMNHDPLRNRKLLLHKREIRKLIGKTKERGYTLVPLSMYINDRGRVKVELALAKGKHVYDKRRELARREIERRLCEAVKRW